VAYLRLVEQAIMSSLDSTIGLCLLRLSPSFREQLLFLAVPSSERSPVVGLLPGFDNLIAVPTAIKLFTWLVSLRPGTGWVVDA
jgi:hypothetical protein